MWISAVAGRHYRRRRWMFAPLFGVCLLSLAATSPNDEVFERVVKQARVAATLPYQPNEMSLPEVLRELNYDTYRMITFRREQGLWFGDRTRFQVQLFHPGYIYKEPVTINQVVDGKVEPVDFNPKFFRYPRFDPGLLANARLGFAGFRLLYPLAHSKPVDEVIAFVGASYFRALATGQVYGISARGLAIDTSDSLPEEFPSFRAFWLCKPPPGAREMEFFALLDSTSVTGAYRFVIKPGQETILDVETRLFFRKPVQVLGLAPVTSMFWRDESDPRPPNDKRPEVHDSDTLLVEDASGKQESHPLRQVDRITTELSPGKNPKGFGLLQRDRNPAHYRDSEAKYSRRPSVFVESLGEWGAGNVRLMQLPATNEYNDNVVAFWEPEKAPAPGDEMDFRYRLHWSTRESNKHERAASDQTQRFQR
jgi:glucans biosynthesis protein